MPNATRAVPREGQRGCPTPRRLPANRGENGGVQTRKRLLQLTALLLLLGPLLRAEDGSAGWLRYAPIPNPAQYNTLPSRIVVLGDTPTDQAAANELQRGLTSILGRPFTLAPKEADTADAIVIANLATLKNTFSLTGDTLAPESFTLRSSSSDHRLLILGADPRGELYGVFHVLAEIAAQRPLADVSDTPAAPIRWVNQWDNLDGSVERGYAGRSIFFDQGHIRPELRAGGDLTRTRAYSYARLLASVGINGCTVNNVNADLHTLSPGMLREFSRIAQAFRPWGVRLSLSVDLSSPQVVGGLPTFDPLDPTVAKWWQKKTDEIYALIPDFAGFVVKADSEGRAGPSQYGRTPAEAANVLARALAPHHGVVLYRGFVYNHHLDWHDLKADRARAGFDNFAALDGKFEPNVIIQIKHGPIDFQAREPVSPLFAALRHTSQAIELQTTQEYTGQQRHMVFLVPMWKTMLDTDLRADNRSTPLKQIVEGRSFPQPDGAPRPGGFVSVVNVGLDTDWLHHPMALANLYGFGRLAWNPDLPSKEIVDTWTRLTWGNNPELVGTISKLQLESWHAYESYTGPLGVGTLTDILGVHFGPGIESAERNGWGQWIRADHLGIGMDRTVATGTGYIGQYPPELAAIYESLATCPDDLLLFMHHVPYTHVLHSGKTVIQHVYDAHYEGAATAATYPVFWRTLAPHIDAQRYGEVLALFEFQAAHAEVWRDSIDQWFLAISGIPDIHNRIGRQPGRIEAESLLSTPGSEGFVSAPGDPVEDASGNHLALCTTAPCTLALPPTTTPGTFDLAVQYFDLHPGNARYELLQNGTVIAHWTANNTLPPDRPDKRLGGQTSTRFTLHNLILASGDHLTLRATPDPTEPAAIDYLQLTPTPHPHPSIPNPSSRNP